MTRLLRALGLGFVVSTAAGACGTSRDVSNEPLGCPGSPVNVAEPNSMASASFAQGCQGATSLITWKDGAPGSSCTDARQCRPTCCYCAPQGRSSLTSWCDHGRCADPDAVCCAVVGTPLRSCGR